MRPIDRRDFLEAGWQLLPPRCRPGPSCVRGDWSGLRDITSADGAYGVAVLSEDRRNRVSR